MDKPYAIAGIVHAKPEKAAELKTVMLSLASRARTEDGCLFFHVNEDRNDPNVLVFYEAWKSEEHINRHLAQPYMTSFMESQTRYLERDAEIHWLSVESPIPVG